MSIFRLYLLRAQQYLQIHSLNPTKPDFMCVLFGDLGLSAVELKAHQCPDFSQRYTSKKKVLPTFKTGNHISFVQYNRREYYVER